MNPKDKIGEKVKLNSLASMVLFQLITTHNSGMAVYIQDIKLLPIDQSC